MRQVVFNNGKAKYTKIPSKEEIEVQIRQVPLSKDKVSTTKVSLSDSKRSKNLNPPFHSAKASKKV